MSSSLKSIDSKVDCYLCDCIKENNNPYLIKEYRDWSLFLNYKQPTIGALVVILNRHAENLLDLTSNEWKDYLNIIKEVEFVLKKSFNPSHINYLILGNIEFHFHCHILPRYDEEINFSGSIWEDKNEGFILMNTDVKSEEILMNIKLKLLEYF